MTRHADGRRYSEKIAHRVSYVLFHWELTPLRGATIYFAFGLAALVLSDVVFVRYLSDPLLSRAQAVKGAVEVLFTAGLVYALLHASRSRLRTVNETLTRRSEELNVLHRVLRHNLRNDLNVIEGYAEQLESRIDSETGRSMCERIRGECDELIRYTEQAARIRKISDREVPYTTVDLAELIPEVIADHELVDDVTVRTDLPERAPVRVNPMFAEAIAELVTNALVHADSTAVSIRVVPDATPDGATLVEVRDDGPGIPAHVRRVFEGPVSDQLIHLDGLGLWFVYLTVIASDGEFAIENGEGSTVRLWVPGA